MLTLIRNSALSFTLNLVTKAANVVVFILIARQRGPEAAGVFSLATTYLLIFSALVWGLDELMVRQVARDREASARQLSGYLLIRLPLTAALYAALFLLVRFGLPYGTSTVRTILLMGLSLFPDGLARVGAALLAAHERFEIPVVGAFAGMLVKVSGAVAALATASGLETVAWFWLVGTCLEAALNLWGAIRRAGRLHPLRGLGRGVWGGQLGMAVPFLVIGSLLTIEYQTDVVILSAVRGEVAVGWYGAATTIAFSLTLIPAAFRAAVYPRMARVETETPARLGGLYDAAFAYLATAAIPLAVGIQLLAPRLIELIYREGFAGAVTPLRIIGWSLLFNFLNVPNSRIMLVKDRQRLLAALLTGSMGLNVILNLLLDGPFGVNGAAVARFASSAAFFLPNYLYVSRRIHPHAWLGALARPAVAAALMAVVVWQVRAAPLAVPVAAGALVYVAARLGMGGLPGLERSRIREAWQAVGAGRLGEDQR